MDVKTVCLGLLSLGEASGYDLKKHFESSIDQFYATGYGSIYPALAALAAEGLVSCETIGQPGRPERKVYRITPQGEAHLRRALAAAEPEHRVRSELLVLFYFAHLLPPERIAGLIDERIAQMEATVRRLRSTNCPAEHQWPASVRFVHGFGAAQLESAVRYMRENRHLLDPSATPQRDGGNGSDGSRRVA